VRAVFSRLPKGLAGDQEAIHEMRVAGRRLRAALPLLAQRPRGKRVKRALKVLQALTRTAGASRDLDVSTDLFEAHLRQRGVTSKEMAVLRRRLRAARARSRSRMAEALMDLEIARLRRDLRQVLGRRPSDLFTILRRVRAARDTLGAALAEGLAALGDRYEPDALHALRRHARRLRYVAEVSDGLLRAEPSDAPNLLRELQAQIGALHDAHVLARWLEAQAVSSESRRQAVLAREARALQALFDEQGRAHHRRLLESQPTELLARALEAMGRARPAA
jgi:CHAD domain-containing protein